MRTDIWGFTHLWQAHSAQEAPCPNAWFSLELPNPGELASCLQYSEKFVSSAANFVESPLQRLPMTDLGLYYRGKALQKQRHEGAVVALKRG